MRRILMATAMILMLHAFTGALPAARADEPQTLTCVVSESQYVNVRKQPRSDAGTWGRLHNGDTIEVEGVSGGWIEFSFGGRTAYVSARYFELDESGWYTVEANGRVRLRDTPNGERVGWLEPGSTVHVNGWRYGSDDALWARCGSQYVAAEYLVQAAQEAE